MAAWSGTSPGSARSRPACLRPAVFRKECPALASGWGAILSSVGACFASVLGGWCGVDQGRGSPRLLDVSLLDDLDRHAPSPPCLLSVSSGSLRAANRRARPSGRLSAGRPGRRSSCPEQRRPVAVAPAIVVGPVELRVAERPRPRSRRALLIHAPLHRGRCCRVPVRRVPDLAAAFDLDADPGVGAEPRRYPPRAANRRCANWVTKWPMPGRTASESGLPAELGRRPMQGAGDHVARQPCAVRRPLSGRDRVRSFRSKTMLRCLNLVGTVGAGHHAALLFDGRRCVSTGAPVSSWIAGERVDDRRVVAAEPMPELPRRHRRLRELHPVDRLAAWRPQCGSDLAWPVA